MKQVMYIGKKPQKKDNVNAEPNRIWYGVGDVVEVSDAECSKLTQTLYADIWKDVTDLDDKARSKLIAKLREQFRADALRVTPAGQVARALGVVSNDELKAELRRRGLEDSKVAPKPATSEPAPLKPVSGSKAAGSEKEPAERPKSTDDVILDISGAILALDREKREHFDDQGAPVLAAVVDVLRYEISQSELDEAVKLVKAS